MRTEVHNFQAIQNLLMFLISIDRFRIESGMTNCKRTRLCRRPTENPPPSGFFPSYPKRYLIVLGGVLLWSQIKETSWAWRSFLLPIWYEIFKKVLIFSREWIYFKKNYILILIDFNEFEIVFISKICYSRYINKRGILYARKYSKNIKCDEDFS